MSTLKKGKGYWTNDEPAKSANVWLEGAQQYQGGWWADWVEWLKPRSGELVVPPPMGSQAYPPIVPAPGMYVMQKGIEGYLIQKGVSDISNSCALSS